MIRLWKSLHFINLICSHDRPRRAFVDFTPSLTNTMCCISQTIHSNKRPSMTAIPSQIDGLVPLFKAADTTTRIPIHNTRPTRRVSFQPAEVVTDVPRGSSLSKEERSKLWYHQDDLIGFKNEARNLSRKIRTNSLGDKECDRGLEHRISIERQKNKCLAIRAILKAQDRHHPEQLARIASRCTAWAKEVALLAGHQDYYQAYNPGLAHLVPTTPQMQQPILTARLERKRQPEVIVIHDDNEELRRARPRLSIQHSSPRRKNSWEYVTVP